MRTSKTRPFFPLYCFFISCLLLQEGCSLVKWKKNHVENEPGIVILERKASPDIQGFNVYRVDPDDSTEEKVNSRLIKPSSNIQDEHGLVTYRVIDRGVIAGLNYYYIFEEVAKDGTKTRWDTPQMMTAQSLTSVTAK